MITTTLTIQIIVLLVVMITLYLTPFFSSKDLAFGIRIPYQERDNIHIKNIKKRYSLFSLIGYTLVLLLFIVTSMPLNILAMVLAILLTFVVCSVFYSLARNQVKSYKGKMNWQVSTNSSKVTIDTNFRKKRIAVSPYWFLLYIPIIIATIVISYFMYDQLPDMLNTQFNNLGAATNSMPKSKALLIAPIVQIAIALLMYFTNYIIIHSKQKNRSEKGNDGRFRFIMSLSLFYLGLTIQLIMLGTQATVMGLISPSILTYGTLATVLVFVLLILGIGLRIGQDGWKLNSEGKHPEDGMSVSQNDDQYWKWGMFYYNKMDPAVFVSKRVGLGYTVNHARPLAWILYSIIVIFIILVFALTL